ncbi:MAG: PDZ domain-containing protein [Candidatus Falkowbacteria bacterium]
MINKIRKNILLVISLSVVFGLAAGACGEIITRVYFLNDFSLPYFSPDVNLTDLNNSRSNLIIRDPKKVVVNQDLKITETINSLSSSLVSVYKEIAAKPSVDPLKPDYYPLDRPLFIGLTITSDGWIMSPVPAEVKDSFAVKGFVAIASDRKIYKIDKITILKDLPGDVVFFHLENATNLPVRKIVPRAEISLGQALLVIDNNNNVWPTTLSSFKKTPDVLNSDSLNARLALANDSEAIQKNSFVFNLSGDLSAVISGTKEIIPAFAFDSYWQSFWKKGLATRPYLGINYINLSAVRIPNLNQDKGALIYPTVDKVSVVKDSPAALAGFVSGDIITWIDNQELNNASDLAELISKYKPGDKITVTYIRDAQEKVVDLKLTELK